RMDLPECKICHVPYDESEHRPRHAPCGHGLCTACIRTLIKDNILECPTCRQTNNFNTPDDLPINYDLIDVIRMLQTINIPSEKETIVRESEASNNEVCSVHCEVISHWCQTCQMWICADCLESHSTVIGCSTITSIKALETMKHKQIKDINALVFAFEEDTQYLSSQLEHHIKLAKKHDEEANKFRNLIEEGKIHKENLLESKTLINSANSPNIVTHRMKEVAQRKQILRSWSVKNLGKHSPLGLLKELKSKEVYVETVIKYQKRFAKLSQHKESIHVHPFLKQGVSDGCISTPFNLLQKMIPDAPLVFMEMSIGDAVIGLVRIRLDKNLPFISDHIVQIFTGQKGSTLSGRRFNNRGDIGLYINFLPFSEYEFTPDKNGTSTAKQGQVTGQFKMNYLSSIYLHTSMTAHAYGSDYHVFGHVEEGMGVIQACLGKNKSIVKISDCGLVIGQE
ncbi:unnamed protein product, partial [Meganyctiphanes norvegica]